LTPALPMSTLKGMEVHFTPDVEAKLNALATETGRAADEFVQDAMAGYFEELAEVRDMLDSRYDDIKSGKVKPIDGEAFFESLRQREEALLKKQAPQ
jgi:predicted DNA-binding protein